MQGYQIGDFCVEYDKPVTADWYQQFEGWTCDCEDCQNFIALAKDKQLPPRLQQRGLSDILRTPKSACCQGKWEAGGNCLTYKC